MEANLELFDDLFSIGIQCMELNVSDVDQAVREFVTKTGQVHARSWKYPTVKLNAVQSHQVISLLRNRHDITKERHYLDLLELLHDRLYYALLVFLKFIKDLINLVNPEEADTNKTGVPMLDDPFYIPVASSQFTENQHNYNIGLLVRQLKAKILQLDICIKDILLLCFLKENLATTNSRALLPLGQAMVKLDRTRETRMLRDKSMHSRDATCQTDAVHVQCCDSCSGTQNILRSIGETLENCLKAFTNEESMLAKTRCELRDQIFWVSQWTSISRWCDALKQDCNTIVRDHKLVVESMAKKNGELEHDLLHERTSKSEMKKKKEYIESKCGELEEKLRTYNEMCRQEAKERIRLENALVSLESIHSELKTSQSETNNNMNLINAHLDNERKEKTNLISTVEKLKEEIKFKEDQINQLISTSTVVEMLKKENVVLRNNNLALRKRTEVLTGNLKDERHQGIHLKNELKKLEQRFQKSQADLELLSSYPDLNGPVIATPEPVDTSDIIGSMQSQLTANATRIDLLTEQNRRLSATIDKLQAHLQNKKQEEIKKCGARDQLM